ncbi:hypothetical protein CCHR01_14335 [Colletotrichum chrysophilum]|uniref:Uncharacterized protein n=1 Tax=Colletotrichum chrysophilum TaxID=1836956 RepID=A0AAD9EC17_9PEZI|nr:hypothetical protein CCHR01_14335 [Colletotrichum chrysophilum]
MLPTDTSKLVRLMWIPPSTPSAVMGSVDSGNCRTALYSVPICRPVRTRLQASNVNDVAHFVVRSTPCKRLPSKRIR